MSDQQAPTGAEITADRGLCAGSGLCKLVAPEYFDVVSGLVEVLRPHVAAADHDAVDEAVESCPMQALTLDRRQ